MPKLIENRLIEEFREREAFSRDELYEFYRSFEPNLKEGTFAWRIYDLKEKNIIKGVKRGWYVISCKPKYRPEISSELLELSKSIGTHFEEVKYCLWDTSWLNEFLQHQTSKWMFIAEIEKEFEETLYFHLKDNFKHEVYLNPDEKEMKLYISESHMPIITNKLITRSPLDKQLVNKHKVSTPKLEKILVDLFSEEKLFYFYRGSEMNILFENALKEYSINYTTLFSYAKRRDREEELKSYLNNNLKHLIIDIQE